MQPLLQIDGVTKSFQRHGGLFGMRISQVRAVDNVSLTLRQGETLGLVGETGSGKSTLGRLVLRLVEPSAGRILLAGRDITMLPRRAVRALRRDVQMVFQDPYGSLDPRMTVGALIAEPMVVHGIAKAEQRARVQDIVHRVGLDRRHLDRYPHEFSGGQRQRIGIARAMAVSPRLLVLDEPVSALDVSIQAQIINLLRQLQRDQGLAYLFIAHDLAVVRHVSDRVAVMYLGRIVETGPRDAIYARPLHPYTVTLLSAVPLADPVRERSRQRVMPRGEIGSATAIPPGCRFHPRCYKALLAVAQGAARSSVDPTLPALCTEHDPKLIEAASDHHVACHFPELTGAAPIA
jgi:oligopeptide transport system ATP-binding protein